ncbi:hypothetical protein [Nereida sp. MMG025]|uniref:hypothetical protein n=1 Tax=Nereida sp. MMG025 TaxID=2909981 RepID=UPI001F1AE98D|nr:hypothetical protein [Nereida sp. MMG025]MCF6445742.1 hypothetical protein [Nereida sp. MMG025]
MASSSSDPIDFYMTLMVSGGWHMVRINDVTFSRASNARPDNFTMPINTYLRTGLNTLSATIVTSAHDGVLGAAPNPNFGLNISMYRLNLMTRERDEVQLLSLAFDPETGLLEQRGSTPAGMAVGGASRPDFGAIGPFETTDGDLIQENGPSVPTRRIELSFMLPDTLPAAPWETAEPLRDTPEMRAELTDTYTDVHAALASRDFARIKPYFLPAWTYTADIMNYDSVDEFIVASEAESIVTGQREGSGPLAQPDLKALGQNRLELMANGKLARFLPAPLYRINPETNKPGYEYPVAFFRDTDGALRIGMIPLA